MSGNFSKTFNDLDNIPYSVDGPIAQQHGCDEAGTAALSPPAVLSSQNPLYMSTSHMDTIRRFTWSSPLGANDSTSNYHFPPHQINTNPEIGPSIPELFPELCSGMNSAVISGNPIAGNDMGENPTDGNYINRTSTHTSFQVPESDFDTNAMIFEGQLPGYFNPNPNYFNTKRPEPHNNHYSAPSSSRGVSTPDSSRKDRRRSEKSPASPSVYPTSPMKYSGDSGGNPSDSRVTKIKKSHRCAIYNCRKVFGRSAELKRHENSVHTVRPANELFHCPHDGCERVGKSGFKRKDNLAQHLRGVHGDHIEKKSGRRSATRGASPRSSASSAGASPPTVATEHGQFPQSQSLFYTNQEPMMAEESGSPLDLTVWWERLEN